MGIIKSWINKIVGPNPAPVQGGLHNTGHSPSPRLTDHDRFVVLDVETTGLVPQRHRIVELAMVTMTPNGQFIDEFVTRLNPEGPVGPTHIHGITQRDVTSAPFFRDVLPALTHRLAGAAIVAHNAAFDMSFLNAEFHRAGWTMPQVECLCTLEASSYYLPKLPRRTLAHCCQHAGVPLQGAHSALGDARATAGLLHQYLNPQLTPAPRQADINLARRAHMVTWPSAPSHAPVPYTAPTSDQPRWAKTAPKPASKALAEMVSRFSLETALEEGAEPSMIAYLEKLAEVLEDGVLTADEEVALADLAGAFNFDEATVDQANRSFLLALAHEALEDGRVSQAERTELKKLAAILDADEKLIPGLLKKAELARVERLGADLPPLPAWWNLGDPLRVGDRVAFTGCDDDERDILESLCETKGVLVMGGVNKKTAMLVTDGSLLGQKLMAAQELGTRIVSPAEFRALLSHIQPN